MTAQGNAGCSWTMVVLGWTWLALPRWPLLAMAGPGWAWLGLAGPGWAWLGQAGPGWAWLDLARPAKPGRLAGHGRISIAGSGLPGWLT